MSTRICTIIVYGLVFISAANATTGYSQERYTWTGGSGLWHVEANWSPAGIPAEEDTAVVSSGTVIVDTLTSVAVMDLRGGRLRASDTLNVDRMRMTGGRFSGGGAIKIIEEMDWPDGLIDGRNQGGANLIILQGAVLHLHACRKPRADGRMVGNLAAPEVERTVAGDLNEAGIVFDTEDPILTGAWINTIDRTPPVSRVEDLGETQASVDFEVAWSGEDDFSGIDTYTIFVSEDGGPFSVWLADTSITSAVFEGEPDVTYGFYSIAVDGVGNVEPEKTEADAVTTIRPVSTEEDLAGIPESFELYRNYPNPFNPVTRIRYDVPERADVRMTVFDALGRRITTLVDGMHSPGRYDVTFDAAALPSGLYLYRMEAGEFRQVRRMVVVK